MKKFIVLIFILSCANKEKLKFEDINRFYIFSESNEVFNYFTSEFDTNFYRFSKLESLDKLGDISNVIILLPYSSKNFLRFYKFVNSDIGYRENFQRNGDFLLAVFGENYEDIRYNLYKNRNMIDSLLRFRVYELFYKRAIYFGIDNEKKNLIKKQFGVLIDIPLGWRFLRDTLHSNKPFFTMFKLNPKRHFTLYFPNFPLNLNYETILNLKRELMKGDSMWNIRLSNKGFDKVCIDGNYKSAENLGLFRSCIGKLTNKFYFYDIGILDTNFFHMIEVDAFLSRMKEE